MSTAAAKQEQLEPGRKLDALVAEKVMGAEMVYPASGWGHDDTPYDSALDVVWRVKWSEQNTKEVLKSYSTDIAAAWTVVEKLEKKHRSFSLTSHDSTGAEPGYYNAMFWVGNPRPANPASGVLLGEGYHDSAPAAICLAALAAVEAKS